MSNSSPQPDRDPLPIEVERQIDRICDQYYKVREADWSLAIR